ncbi:peptidoglycan-binding protein [Oceaniglobus ichthyenteri]|uniref:peptidoglycan-binding protein n=1 Tax=Oceaniglobus ichthyenteri TaxID=2136177 RepID=UPI000D36EBCE|nr:peptidoglycan-binding protein [Oceaniglobus ichthyenteri]
MGRWTRRTWAALVVVGLAAPVWAEDIALVIGNSDYRDLGRVAGANRVVTAAAALRDEDVAVIAGQDVSLIDMRDLVSQFEQMATQADALLVVLAGQFVTGGNETFYLPIDSDLPGLTALPGQSLPLSLVMQLLASAPGQAFLVLAEDGRDEERGPFLRDGIGDLAIPQGVTVLRGESAEVADLLRDQLAMRGGVVNRVKDIQVSGFLPDNHGFLRDETGVNSAALAEARTAQAQAEQRALTAERALRALRSQLDRIDDAAWTAAQKQDDADGYVRYVEMFPQGAHADEAGRLIDQISGDPFRNARMAEEALNLTRAQRRSVQQDLTALGFNTRGIDGIFGQGTRTAIRNWQARIGREQSGYLDSALLRTLDNEARAAEAAKRAEEEARKAEQEREDRAFWRRLGSGATESGLRAYLDRYPKGLFAAEARSQLARIDRDRRAEEEARQEQERRRQDIAFWRAQGEGGSESGLRAYLNRFPRGEFAKEARARLNRIEKAREEEENRNNAEEARQREALFWKSRGSGASEKGVREYLSQYPNGRWADEARRRLAEFEADREPVAKGESVAWAMARKTDSVSGYRNFLNNYPNSTNVETARARIAELQGNNDQARETEEALGLNQLTRTAVEAQLAKLGHDPGPVDGTFDGQTRQAIRAYQRANRMVETGFLTKSMVVGMTIGSVFDRIGR